MPQQINKKILLYLFLFIILGTINNKNLNKFNFPKINQIQIYGLETDNNNFNKKIMVSNGRSLAIKNKTSNQYYLYPLKRTPLELILDKDYLISQIKNLEARTIKDKYLNFTLIKNNNKINIFFDNQTLNLIGWQTEDIYQNLVITFIYRVKLNQKIDKNIFKLPKMN